MVRKRWRANWANENQSNHSDSNGSEFDSDEDGSGEFSSHDGPGTVVMEYNDVEGEGTLQEVIGEAGRIEQQPDAPFEELLLPAQVVPTQQLIAPFQGTT